MVKRPKSPEIIEEVRYFTVCQPFPLNANWLFPEDQKDCATWIAECIGLEHLYGIHYKPSARGMILLEVSKSFTQHERLLGEHRWSEILKDADEEEENRVSRVFHSFYAKGRDAQKDGWKGLVVNAGWFKNWSPGKGRFKQPYPQTHWCSVPVEDQTNKPLCRPLPVDRMPPPPRVEPPVVGSQKWIQRKNSNKPTVEALNMAYDEDISSVEAINKVNERAQAKLNEGPISPLDERSPTTTSPSSEPFYPPLSASRITTSAPIKPQATSNLVPNGKNKKKTKPTPLSQLFGNEGGKKSTPMTWNKVTPVATAPAVLNGPLPKPTPPANAWDRPIKIKAAPVAAVKKETPAEDYSSWGQEPATSTVDQEDIWKLPPTPKSSKKGKGRAETPSASSTSQGITQPSTPQVQSTPTSTISSSSTRDVPPHQIPHYPEEDDSDYESMYVGFSDMKFPDINDLETDEMEYAHVNAWERGDDFNALDSDIPVPEGREYQNLWSSEDDPRAVPPPAIICPVHRIGCKKGICEDMSRILKEMKRAELKAKWEKESLKKAKGKKKKVTLGGDDEKNKDAAVEVEVDNDNFAKAHKGKRVQDNEPSFTGRMRAFSDDPAPSDDERNANGEASGSGSKVNSAPEGQVFDQW